MKKHDKARLNQQLFLNEIAAVIQNYYNLLILSYRSLHWEKKFAANQSLRTFHGDCFAF